MPSTESTDRNLKATKADDAQVPIWLWNEAIREDLKEDPTVRGYSEPDVERA
jgi:hypothetical protein